MKKSLYCCLFLCLGLFSCQKESINVSTTDQYNPLNDSPFSRVVVSVQMTETGNYSGTGGGGCNANGENRHNALTNAEVVLYKAVAEAQNNETLPAVATGATDEDGQAIFGELQPEEYRIVVRTLLGEQSRTVKTTKGTASLVVFNF